MLKQLLVFVTALASSFYFTSLSLGVPCWAIGHQVLPLQLLLREADDFLRIGKHPKHVHLMQYLKLKVISW